MQRGQQAALLLLAMGKPLAMKVLARLETDELRLLNHLTRELDTVTAQDLEHSVEDFANNLVKTVSLERAADEVRGVINAALHAERQGSTPVAELLAPEGGDEPKLEDLLESVPPAELATLLAAENKATVAQLLASVSPVLAAELLEKLPEAMRLDLVRGMVTVRPMTDRARQVLTDALRRTLDNSGEQTAAKAKQVKIAGVLNRLDAQLVQDVLAEMREADPKLAAGVESRLFGFADLGKLSSKARAALFEKVPVDQTVLALRDADAETRELVLSALTARGRRMMEAELSITQTVDPQRVKAARRAIADLALDMGSRGDIELPQAKADE